MKVLLGPVAPKHGRVLVDGNNPTHPTVASILLVEQNANAPLQIAHRASVLRKGTTVLSGEAAALIGDPAVDDAYLAGSRGE